MDEFIYHKITSGYLTLMNNLRADHGQKSSVVGVHSRTNKFCGHIGFSQGTRLPGVHSGERKVEITQVEADDILHKKDLDKVREDTELLRLCSIKIISVGGSRVLPCGKPWVSDKEEVSIKEDHLRIMNIEKVRAMKGDLISTACNMSFELWDHSSGGAGTARDKPSSKGKWK